MAFLALQLHRAVKEELSFKGIKFVENPRGKHHTHIMAIIIILLLPR